MRHNQPWHDNMAQLRDLIERHTDYPYGLNPIEPGQAWLRTVFLGQATCNAVLAARWAIARQALAMR